MFVTHEMRVPASRLRMWAAPRVNRPVRCLDRGIRLAALIICAVMGRVNIAAMDPTPAKGAILILGDSLAAGYGLEASEAFPSLLQQKIEAVNLPFEVINAGLSGDTSAGGLRRLNWLLKRKIDVLVLELGGNDGLRGISPASTRTNLQAIIDRTREKCPEARIVIAGMQMPPNMGPEYVREFQDVFPGLARANGAALIPFLLEGVGGRTELNQADRIHPTAEGQKIVAANVWKILQPLLPQIEPKPAPR